MIDGQGVRHGFQPLSGEGVGPASFEAAQDLVERLRDFLVGNFWITDEGTRLIAFRSEAYVQLINTDEEHRPALLGEMLRDGRAREMEVIHPHPVFGVEARKTPPDSQAATA